MTTAILQPTGLEALVDAIRAQVRRSRDWDATAESVGEALRRHLPEPGFFEREGSAHRLHVEPHFSILAIVWQEGQWTRIHDHVTWCVFAGIAGEVVEESFRLQDGSLVPAGEQACPAGAIRLDVPPGDIHRLGNPHPQTAITLHVYGTDVTRLGTSARRTYDLPVSRPAA